jgi:hypothetical protein
MAARTKRTELDKEWRSRIQTGVILKRLQDHLSGALELSTTQIKAAEILLRKSIPDLSATTISGDADNPLAVEVTDALASLLQRPAVADGEEGIAGANGSTVQ